MKKIIIGITLMAIFAVANAAQYAPRIVGGELANPADFEWSVALSYGISADGISLPGVSCSGTLIAPDVVLTAGHCITMYHGYNEDTYLDSYDRYVAIGGGNALTGEGVEIRKVDAVRLGVDYEEWCTSAEPSEEACNYAYWNTKDYALMHLSTPSTKPTMPLASQSVIDSIGAAGAVVTMAGRGRNDDPTDSQRGQLYTVDINLALMGDSRDNTHLMVTAQGKALCGGDSGGPTIYQGTVVGANSWSNRTQGSGWTCSMDGIGESGIGKIDVGEVAALIASFPAPAPEIVVFNDKQVLEGGIAHVVVQSTNGVTNIDSSNLSVAYSIEPMNGGYNVVNLTFPMVSASEDVIVTVFADGQSKNVTIRAINAVSPIASDGETTLTCEFANATSGHISSGSFIFDTNIVDNPKKTDMNMPVVIQRVNEVTSTTGLITSLSGKFPMIFGGNNVTTDIGTYGRYDNAWFDATPGSYTFGGNNAMYKTTNGWAGVNHRTSGWEMMFSSNTPTTAIGTWSASHPGYGQGSGSFTCTTEVVNNDLEEARVALQTYFDSLKPEFLEGDEARLQQYIDDAQNMGDINWSRNKIDEAHQQWVDRGSVDSEKARLQTLLDAAVMFDDDRATIGDTIRFATSLSDLADVEAAINVAVKRWDDNQDNLVFIAEQTRLTELLNTTTMHQVDFDRILHRIDSATLIGELATVENAIANAHQKYLDDQASELELLKSELRVALNVAEMSDADRTMILDRINSAEDKAGLTDILSDIEDAVQRFIDTQSQEEKDRIAKLQATLLSELNAADVLDDARRELTSLSKSVTDAAGAAEWRIRLAAAVEAKLEFDTLSEYEKVKALTTTIRNMINGNKLTAEQKAEFTTRLNRPNQSSNDLLKLKREVQVAIDELNNRDPERPKKGNGSFGWLGLFGLFIVGRYRK